MSEMRDFMESEYFEEESGSGSTDFFIDSKRTSDQQRAEILDKISKAKDRV
jgi:hypothetical protein